jgi:hypothetical protein
MLATVLFILAIATLLYGARILWSRHGSARPLQRIFGGVLVLFVAGVFLDAAVMAVYDEGPVLHGFLRALPGSVAICLVLGLIIQVLGRIFQKARMIRGFHETGGAWNAAESRGAQGAEENRGARGAARYDDSYYNPATGLYMVGGIGGVDTAGNSWGSSGDND